MWLFLDNLPALFSKTNSRINIKHLTVALSYGFHCTWKQLFNIHFLSAIFEEVGEISAWSMRRWCLVWCGTVVCDPSSCIGVARSFVHSFYSSVHSSDSPGRSGEEKKDFLSPPPIKKSRTSISFHLSKMLSKILTLVCVCCFTSKIITVYIWVVHTHPLQTLWETIAHLSYNRNHFTVCVVFSHMVNK